MKAGQTVFIAKGERFKPEFPDGNTEYVPVCLPAFRPDRCIREDDPNGAVPTKLAALHSGAAKTSAEPEAEVIYHMCQVSLWEKAKASGEALFAPTFEKDGFTHATAVPSRLIQTANYAYQEVPGEWVCLRFKRSALRKLGIITKDEGAYNCPHVFGGLAPQVVARWTPRSTRRTGSSTSATAAHHLWWLACSSRGARTFTCWSLTRTSWLGPCDGSLAPWAMPHPARLRERERPLRSTT